MTHPISRRWGGAGQHGSTEMDVSIARDVLVNASERSDGTLYVVRHECRGEYMQFQVFSTRAKAEDWAAEVREDHDYVGRQPGV